MSKISASEMELVAFAMSEIIFVALFVPVLKGSLQATKQRQPFFT